jgi:hypothetical protein
MKKRKNNNSPDEKKSSGKQFEPEQKKINLTICFSLGQTNFLAQIYILYRVQQFNTLGHWALKSFAPRY